MLDHHRLVLWNLQPDRLPAGDAKQITDYMNWMPWNPFLNQVAEVYLRYGIAGAVCSIAPAPLCCSKKLTGWLRTVGRRQQRIKVKEARGALEEEEEAAEELQSTTDDEEEGQDSEDDEFVMGGSGAAAEPNNGMDNEVGFVNALFEDVHVVRVTQLEQARIYCTPIHVPIDLFLHRLHVGLHWHFPTRKGLRSLLRIHLPKTHACLQWANVDVDKVKRLLQLRIQQSRDAAVNAARNGVASFHVSGYRG